LKKLTRRFDILHNLQEDLIGQCEKLVPREEVEQALRALLNELKTIKNNSVTSDVLKESLKAKANAAEVQKYERRLSLFTFDYSVFAPFFQNIISPFPVPIFDNRIG
jgi:hypothetical protein